MTTSSGVARTEVLFVTIDRTNKLTEPSQDHQPNIERLSEIVATAPVPLRVTPIYFKDVTADRLAQEQVFMLFLAGSFPEWCELWQDPDWEQSLRAFGELIRETRVPVYATCGSHQFVAAVYAGWGWGAIAHMARDGEPVNTVECERADQMLRLPNDCRLGEVGAFPLSVSPAGVGDPILNGFEGTLWLVFHHYDEVLESTRPPGFVSLLEPSAETPEQDCSNYWDPAEQVWKPAEGRWHGPVWRVSERCRVMLLKLQSEDKVLYTGQFHPELPAARVSGSVSGAYTDGDESHRDVAHRDHLSTYWMTDTHGQRFVLNFVGIASEAWARMDGGLPVA